MKLSETEKREAVIRQLALDYPEAYEEFPWGERAVKVKGKVFLFMRAGESEISFSVKLPQSNAHALALKFTEPTHYGLGRSGWVTAVIASGAPLPLELIRSWIDESYRAVGPKKLVATLEGKTIIAPPKPAKKKPAKKTVRKAAKGD